MPEPLSGMFLATVFGKLIDFCSDQLAHRLRQTGKRNQTALVDLFESLKQLDEYLERDYAWLDGVHANLLMGLDKDPEESHADYLQRLEGGARWRRAVETHPESSSAA